MHSIAFNYAPISFENTWLKNRSREREFNLRNDDDFIIPAPRIEIFKKLLLFALPTEWNNSGVLKFYANRFTFKHALKDQLIEEILMEN